MNEKKGSWYLLTGLVAGLVFGLVYAWVISPLAYVDTTPATLRDDYKDAYRLSIALVYRSTGDLARAEARLHLLEDADPAQALAAQAQRYLADGKAESDVKALGILAAALRATPMPGGTASQPEGAPASSQDAQDVPETPAPETQDTASLDEATPLETTSEQAASGTESAAAGTAAEPAVTMTPSPTVTPSPTAGLPFVLKEKKQICNPDLPAPLIQVVVMDAAGTEVPGVTLVINWDEAEEKFFTGLKPEMGMGYGDFTMAPEKQYTVHVADGGELVKDLSVHECRKENGDAYQGGWLLVFNQP